MCEKRPCHHWCPVTSEGLLPEGEESWRGGAMSWGQRGAWAGGVKGQRCCRYCGKQHEAEDMA